MLARVRRAKTEAKVSQRAEVASLTVEGPAALLAQLDTARADLLEAGSVRQLIVATADELRCDVSLAAGD